MKSFSAKNTGQTVILHLKKGDLVLENITEEFRRLGIRDAVLASGIGSLRKMAYHVITQTTDQSVDEFATLEDAIEVGAMQGMILDGEPHLHLVCSGSDGKTYVGHLENGTEVQYLLELAFTVLDTGGLGRKKDEFGISYIDIVRGA